MDVIVKPFFYFLLGVFLSVAVFTSAASGFADLGSAELGSVNLVSDVSVTETPDTFVFFGSKSKANNIFYSYCSKPDVVIIENKYEEIVDFASTTITSS